MDSLKLDWIRKVLLNNRRIPVAYDIPTLGRYTCPETETIINKVVNRSLLVNAGFSWYEQLTIGVRGRHFGGDWPSLAFSFI